MGAHVTGQMTREFMRAGALVLGIFCAHGQIGTSAEQLGSFNVGYDEWYQPGDEMHVTSGMHAGARITTQTLQKKELCVDVSSFRRRLIKDFGCKKLKKWKKKWKKMSLFQRAPIIAQKVACKFPKLFPKGK